MPRSARETLSPFEDAIKSSLQNALSDQTGLETDDIRIKPEDWQALLAQTAAIAEDYAQKIGAQTGVRRRATTNSLIQNFGSGNTASPNAPTKLELGVDDNATDILNDETSAQPRSQVPTTPTATPTSVPTPTDSATSPADNDWQGEDQGLQHCPYDGQILNSDGTCPAGDHTALGKDPKQAQPNTGESAHTPTVGANPNPRSANRTGTPNNAPNNQGRTAPTTPPPTPPRAYTLANNSQEGQQKMATLSKQISSAQKELAGLKKELAGTEKKALWIRLITFCGCATIVLPIITSGFLFLNHQKKSKIEKEIKRVEEQIRNLTEARNKVAKQYNLKA